MPKPLSTLVWSVAALITSTSAQTYSSCNPTNTTCSPNPGLAQWSYSANFTGSDAASLFKESWTAAEGTTVTYGDNGIIFTISDEGQAPTVTSNFYFFFGRVDVKMQAAPGTGVVSSIVLESDDLDEVDWEALGGNTSSIETNYFGKGNTASYDRATYVDVTLPQTSMHTYSIEWTASSIVWSIDGERVRTLASGDADNGQYFPQTPLAIKLGSWDGGASTNAQGTIDWAGGLTDFSQAPFVMYVESITVTNYNPADFYNWTDHTGDWTSIKAYNSSSASKGSSSTSTNGYTVTTSNGVAVTNPANSNSSTMLTGLASRAAVISTVVVLVNLAIGVTFLT